MSPVAPRAAPTERSDPTERARRVRWGSPAIAGAVALSLAAACARSPGTTPPPPPPPALALLTSAAPPPSVDTFEVWVCRVPATTTDPIYLVHGTRLDLTPEDVTGRLEAAVPAYYAELSGGAYRPEFVVGGEVTIEPAHDHQDCIDGALERSRTLADAVYVVADAEHGADQPGGLASPGSGCTCPARTSRRMVYVGASDFAPAWGPTPAIDLTEHEIGHTLGLPHSTHEHAADGARGHTYSSALDVMSNSAAPRDVDPGRRHGPATIAANLLALGWLPRSAAVVVPPAGTDVTLIPSILGTDRAPLGATSVPRTPSVAVIALDDHRLLTVELLAPVGLDDHLPQAGIAVHLVDQSPGVCGRADGAACTGSDRRQVVLGSVAPHTDLLTAGEQLEVHGWRIEVAAVAADGSTATVALRPTHR